jgi:hypothetical protein
MVKIKSLIFPPFYGPPERASQNLAFHLTKFSFSLNYASSPANFSFLVPNSPLSNFLRAMFVLSRAGVAFTGGKAANGEIACVRVCMCACACVCVCAYAIMDVWTRAPRPRAAGI